MLPGLNPRWCPHVSGEVQRQRLYAGARPSSIRSVAELVVLGGDFHLDDRARKLVENFARS